MGTGLGQQQHSDMPRAALPTRAGRRTRQLAGEEEQEVQLPFEITCCISVRHVPKKMLKEIATWKVR